MIDEKRQREHYAQLLVLAADYEGWAQASEGDEAAEHKRFHRSLIRLANQVKGAITDRLFNSLEGSTP